MFRLIIYSLTLAHDQLHPNFSNQFVPFKVTNRSVNSCSCFSCSFFYLISEYSPSISFLDISFSDVNLLNIFFMKFLMNFSRNTFLASYFYPVKLAFEAFLTIQSLFFINSYMFNLNFCFTQFMSCFFQGSSHSCRYLFTSRSLNMFYFYFTLSLFVLLTSQNNASAIVYHGTEKTFRVLFLLKILRKSMRISLIYLIFSSFFSAGINWNSSGVLMFLQSFLSADTV